MLEQDIRFLAEELEKGKLVVFVGAGVSKNSGLPEWEELIKDYADYRGIKEFTSKQFLTIPEEVFERYGSLKYYEIAEKRFLGKYVPNSIHRILKKMKLTYIITTNYDTLIEDEIKNLQIVSKDEDLPYTNSNRILIKMHGDFENKNIVLKKSDYDNYEKNFQLISTLVKGLFTTNTVLFIGYSYSDTNVQQIMNWIKEILKEKTRKAFLVEFTNEDNKEEENGEQINKISLKLLNDNNDEVLYENKKEMPKISKNDKIKNFINKNNLKIKCYFLRIIDETYFEELKNEILKEIKETLDIESYSFLLNQKFIDFIPETEDKILEELDEIFQKKDDNKDLNIDNLVNLISKQENILDFLLVSGLNDRLPISFIEKLRNYENEEFFKSLEQYQLKVLWKYILYSDYSEFTGNELEKFSKIGIKNLLKKNDKKLIKLVREYIFFKIKNNDKISNNSIVEAYFEWESEKIETSR